MNRGLCKESVNCAFRPHCAGRFRRVFRVVFLRQLAYLPRTLMNIAMKMLQHADCSVRSFLCLTLDTQYCTGQCANGDVVNMWKAYRKPAPASR